MQQQTNSIMFQCFESNSAYNDDFQRGKYALLEALMDDTPLILLDKENQGPSSCSARIGVEHLSAQYCLFCPLRYSSIDWVSVCDPLAVESCPSLLPLQSTMNTLAGSYKFSQEYHVFSEESYEESLLFNDESSFFVTHEPMKPTIKAAAVEISPLRFCCQ